MQAKSCDNALEPGPLHGQPSSAETRVSGPCQLVPEPSKWVGGVVVLVVDLLLLVVVMVVLLSPTRTKAWLGGVRVDEVLVFNKSYLIAISRY